MGSKLLPNGTGVSNVGMGANIKVGPDKGGTIKDISNSIRPEEKVSQNAFQQSLVNESKLRGVSGKIGGKTNMDTYGEFVDAEKFGGTAQRRGSLSMFNQYAVFVHSGADYTNDLLNTPDNPRLFEYNDNAKVPTIESLINDFDSKSEIARPYFATDFWYARFFKLIPLNRLITLRRFPFPTYDNLNFVSGGNGSDNKFPPIAQAVTFFGEPTGNNLKDLTKLTGYINWKELQAQVHDVDGNEQGQDESPWGKLGSSKLAKGIGYMGNPGGSDLGGFKAQEVEYLKKYDNFEYTNKVIGPVNVVEKTFVRDRGIGANQEFNIVFEYELRSYNNVNPRVAMLDLMCNMLALSFNNAKFWGGANRYFPRVPQFGFLGDQRAFYSGRYGDYMESVIGQVTVGMGGIGDKLGDLLSGILSGNLSGLLNMAKQGGTKFMDLKRAKNRPNVIGFHALLSGLPIGEWHLTVGNPYRPILMIGNLIVDGWEMEWSDNLSFDDFPSNLKFTIKLKHGRPRDKGDIESMYNFGEGRLYYPPDGLIDVGNTTSTTGTGPKISTIGNPGQSQLRNKANVDNDYLKKLAGTIF